KFCCLHLRFLDHRVSLCLRIRKDRISVGNDLLITLDLVRCLHTELSKQFIQMLLIHNDLCRGKRLELTIPVDIFLDLFNNLLNTAAHSYTLLFVFIFFLSSSATASGTNCDKSPPKAAISLTVVELR